MNFPFPPFEPHPLHFSAAVFGAVDLGEVLRVVHRAVVLGRHVGGHQAVHVLVADEAADAARRGGDDRQEEGGGRGVRRARHLRGRLQVGNATSRLWVFFAI